MVKQRHRLNGCESEQTPGDGRGQGSRVGCCPRGDKESDTTWQLNPADNKHMNSSSLVIREIEIKATVRAHAH